MSKLRVSQIYHDEQLSLLAVESIDIVQHKADWSVHTYVNLTPQALIVRSAECSQALDMEGHSLTLEQLYEQFPTLNELLV